MAVSENLILFFFFFGLNDSEESDKLANQSGSTLLAAGQGYISPKYFSA